jgi:hypothetical protein
VGRGLNRWKVHYQETGTAAYTTFFQHSCGFGDTPEMMGSRCPPLTTPEFSRWVPSAESGAKFTNVVRYTLRNGWVPTGPLSRQPTWAKATPDQQNPVAPGARRGRGTEKEAGPLVNGERCTAVRV